MVTSYWKSLQNNKPAIKIQDIVTTFNIYLKIIRWWMKEIEATTNPDFVQAKYKNTDLDSAQTFGTLILRTIIQKALPGNGLTESEI